MEIPLCQQFAPSRPWSEIVPGHAEPPGAPREWVVALIRQMTQAVESRQVATPDSRLVGEYLTGRPLKAAESHAGWFLAGLESEVGNLSNGQLWTLCMWAAADWMRSREGTYLLPLADGRVLRYAERVWQPPAEASDNEIRSNEERSNDER